MQYVGCMPAVSANINTYLEDSSGYRGEAEKVLAPESAEEVREIVRSASKQNIPLTLAGAGTGLVGGRVPHGGWVVSLEKFRKLEIKSGRAICGTGVSLADLQQAASATRQFFGPNPTESTASIGGIISTNAGGARSFHYGSVRYHVLSLEVTFMRGETVRFERGERVDIPYVPVRLPATTKNSAGYNLKPNLEWTDLLSGSEGTLGIITEAELQLLPEPGAVLSGVIFFPTDYLALDAVEAWRPLPELRLLEFLDSRALDFLRPSYPDIPREAQAALFIEQNLVSEDDEEIDLWSDRLHSQGAYEEESWFGLTAKDRERFREFRHALPVAVIDLVRKNGFPKFGTDFAVPFEKNRELYNVYKGESERDFPNLFTIYGHVGDANNHVNLFPYESAHVPKGARLMEKFAQYVLSVGGTVAAEHGIGKSKTDLFKLMFSEDDIVAMKNVKRLLDPQWLLSQGNIFEM
jgi:FAD/FMN-containing dehydrogenase